MALLFIDFAADGGYLLVVNLAILASAVLLGSQEIKGCGLRYSKFAQENKEILELPSKLAMFLFYAPAAVLAAVFLAYKLTGTPPLQTAFELAGYSKIASLISRPTSLRLSVFVFVVFIHFFKRVLEVLFLHKYSGNAGILSSIVITLVYTFATVNLIYSQQISEALEPPTWNLQWIGVVLFLIGIFGNFYHHFLLAGLRSGRKTTSKYVVPRGGLFELVACPHYLFEIVDFLGIAMVAQTVTSCSMFLLVATYLTSRSIATREWYLKKVDGFPASRKALFPLLL